MPPRRADDVPVFAVPGRDAVSDIRLLCRRRDAAASPAFSPPSSDAMSVIRDDMMLGGPVGSPLAMLPGFGKLSSTGDTDRPASVASFEAMVGRLIAGRLGLQNATPLQSSRPV